MPHLRRSAIAAFLIATTAAGTHACGSFGEDTSAPVGGDGGDSGIVGADAAPAPLCDPDPAKLASDPFHCGRCDHSCLGGACQAGMCQPALVGRTRGELFTGLAVDATQVIWVTNNAPGGGVGHVWACPKTGCAGAEPKSLAPEGKQVGSVAGDGVTAYVSFLFGTRAINQIGPGVLNVIDNEHRSAEGFHVRDGALFYLSRFEAPSMDGGYAGRLFSWRDGSATLIGAYDGPGTININRHAASAGGRVFISSYGVIERCENGGCAPFADTFNKGGVIVLGAGDDHVYWTNENGQVLSCLPQEARARASRRCSDPCSWAAARRSPSPSIMAGST